MNNTISVDDLPRTLAQREADEFSEFDHQVAVMQWAALQVLAGRTELELLHASQNGLWTTPSQAGKAKAAGMRAGVPDLCLPVARGGYHAAYIEMKAGRGKVRPAQSWWHERLHAEGCFVATCWCHQDAELTLAEYLDGKFLSTNNQRTR